MSFVLAQRPAPLQPPFACSLPTTGIRAPHQCGLLAHGPYPQVLGLPEPSRYPTPPPAALCRATLAAALAAVPREVAQRYEQYGRKVEPKEDRWVGF